MLMHTYEHAPTFIVSMRNWLPWLVFYFIVKFTHDTKTYKQSANSKTTLYCKQSLKQLYTCSMESTIFINS